MRKLLALTLAFGLVAPAFAFESDESLTADTSSVSRNYMDVDADVEIEHPIQDLD